MNNIKQVYLWLSVFLIGVFSMCVSAHEDGSSHQSSSATYLGNEGVLISSSIGKVLFDPFFHNNYGSYQLVPQEIREAIFNGEAPYDGVKVVVISHAHGDHFSAEDSLAYLKKHSSSKLLAPKQAIDMISALPESGAVKHQLVSIHIAVGDEPVVSSFDAIEIESVRIPHAGWPSRKEISNLVHRVTFGGDLSVIHMGDADPNDVHCKPYAKYWSKTKSDVAFAPYWFYTSEQGPMILSDRLNVDRSIGVHVPIDVPQDLKSIGADYFSTPGEYRRLGE